MIPDLSSVPARLLAEAELSLPLQAPGPVGVSLFFTDERDFAVLAGLAGEDPDALVRDERAMRRRFDLLPRYWIKLQFRDRDRVGLSRYFQVHPRNDYPITTLRMFLRSHGFPDVETIEAPLRCALRDSGTQWGLALKRASDRSFPRIFCGIARALLPELLQTSVGHGWIDGPSAGLYQEWCRKLEAGDRVFVSIDPPPRVVSSVDFVDVPSRQAGLPRSSSVPERLRYLKVRIPDAGSAPSFTAYVPLQPSAIEPAGGRTLLGGGGTHPS